MMPEILTTPESTELWAGRAGRGEAPSSLPRRFKIRTDSNLWVRREWSAVMVTRDSGGLGVTLRDIRHQLNEGRWGLGVTLRHQTEEPATCSPDAWSALGTLQRENKGGHTKYLFCWIQRRRKERCIGSLFWEYSWAEVLFCWSAEANDPKWIINIYFESIKSTISYFILFYIKRDQQYLCGFSCCLSM